MRRFLDTVVMVLSKSRLDLDLAAGLPPETSDRHYARARYLTDPRTRTRLADSWESVISSAHERRRGLSSRVPICRARVRDAETTIIELVQALRVSGPVPARGAAIAMRLLTDAGAPTYNQRSADDLDVLLRLAIDNLNPHLPLSTVAVMSPRW